MYFFYLSKYHLALLPKFALQGERELWSAYTVAAWYDYNKRKQ